MQSAAISSCSRDKGAAVERAGKKQPLCFGMESDLGDATQRSHFSIVCVGR
jgi:hypothetical protein